jgi:hypothetical protein
MMPDFGGLDSRRARRQAREYSIEQAPRRAERAERHIIATAKFWPNYCAVQKSVWSDSRSGRSNADKIPFSKDFFALQSMTRQARPFFPAII